MGLRVFVEQTEVTKGKRLIRETRTQVESPRVDAAGEACQRLAHEVSQCAAVMRIEGRITL